MCVTSFFSMTQKNIFPIKCPVTIWLKNRWCRAKWQAIVTDRSVTCFKCIGPVQRRKKFVYFQIKMQKKNSKHRSINRWQLLIFFFCKRLPSIRYAVGSSQYKYLLYPHVFFSKINRFGDLCLPPPAIIMLINHIIVYFYLLSRYRKLQLCTRNRRKNKY
jgi:hypothetical protein